MAARAPMQLEGRTALITGAGGGIGRAIAVSLARRGCNLALADIDPAGLEETTKRVGAGVKISRHRLDVSDRAAVAAFPQAISAEHGGLDILVNNAGVAIGGTFEQVSEADFDWLLSINLFGVVNMTRAFLPALKASPDARIVNLSSIFGIVAPPGQSAYVTSKFAVRGFSESLRHELANTRVGVTVVHPGGVATSIARNARAPKGATPEQTERQVKRIEAKLTLPPAVAGETIVRAIVERRPRVLVGTDARIGALIERLFPVGYWSILGRAVG
jgi:NAD(P)-dependent dehydrogenase (short-subunit alcohol dehydrogenase family)